MDILFNLPLLLAVVLFIGVVALVRLLLAPVSALDRRSRTDRRSGDPMPSLPFYDAERKLVVEDRRNSHVTDRRKHIFIITTEHKRI